MATSNNQPQAELQVQTDGQGDWQAQLPQNLPPGMHTVVVTTQDGQKQEVAMYSLQKETRTFTNTIKELPWTYVYPLLFLLFLVLLAALSGFRLLGVRKNTPRANKSQTLPVALILAAVLFGVTFVGYVVWDMSRNKANDGQFGEQGQQTSVVAYDRLSGAVINPWNAQPVSSVKLNLGDVSITTQEGGRYNFTSVTQDARIRLSNASMTKDVLVKPIPDGNGIMDVYFEPVAYAAVWNVVSQEAAGELSKIYAQSPEGLKAKIKESDFMGTYLKLADKPETLENDLVINKMEVADNYVDDVNQLTYPRALLLDLELGGASGRYGVVMENGSAKVFRR